MNNYIRELNKLHQFVLVYLNACKVYKHSSIPVQTYVMQSSISKLLLKSLADILTIDYLISS